MSERKLTNEEVIKALECCSYATSNKDCEKCPYYPDEECVKKQCTDILDLINRQKAEIGKLNRECNKQQLKRQMYRSTVDEIKTEAIKEFAEEFEKRCLASGIYPVLIKNILKNLVKEKTEGNND